MLRRLMTGTFGGILIGSAMLGLAGMVGSAYDLFMTPPHPKLTQLESARPTPQQIIDRDFRDLYTSHKIPDRYQPTPQQMIDAAFETVEFACMVDGRFTVCRSDIITPFYTNVGP